MKRSLFVFLLAVLVLGAWAQAISEQDAKARVLQYLQKSERVKARGGKPIGEQLALAKVGAEKIYAFNLEGGGYVIASGDSRALPVLGYSDSGHIDWENMPASMKWWLKSYDEAIASLCDHQFVDGNPMDGRAMTRAETMTAIAPLLAMHWDQMGPYYDQCPIYDGEYAPYKGMRGLAGCVATAMAQVMAYHQWPREACKAIPAYDFEYAFEGKSEPCHMDALPSIKFSWDQMLNNYTEENPGTTAQREAVAELMRYCGQSANMVYSPVFSGAFTIDVLRALRNYFGYDQGARFVRRVFCSIAEWEGLIYQELAAGRPVQYTGYSDDAGHSFVCDGYDGEGLFHINWGWGGTDDGFFSLSVLNPYNNVSAGSGSSGIGFCIDQECIVGVKPASSSAAYEPILPSVSLRETPWIEDVDKVGFYALKYGADYPETPIRFALGTRSAQGVLTPMFVVKDTVHQASVSKVVISIDSTKLQKSSMLNLYPMVKFDIDGCDWQMIASQDHYVVAGKTFNGLFFLGKDVPAITCEKAFISKGRGYLEERSDVTLTLRNGGAEYNGNLYLQPIYLGDSTDPKTASEDKVGDVMECGAYLPAGKRTDITFSFMPKARGNVLLQLFTPDRAYLDGAIIQVNDTLRAIEKFVSLEHELVCTEHFGEDFTLEPYEGDEFLTGMYQHVAVLKKIPNATLPEGCVISDRLIVFGGYAGADYHSIDKQMFDVGDFFKLLPSHEEDEDYSIYVPNTLSIPSGGDYILYSIGAAPSDDEGEPYYNWNNMNGFTVKDTPNIRVSGDSVVASGSPVELDLYYTTGYPYKATDFTGDEIAKWELYQQHDDNSFEFVSAGEQKLSFATPTHIQRAVVDTIPQSFTLPDGKYLLYLSSTWDQMPTRDVFLTVGSVTGISSVEADRRDGVFYDLQGRRLEGTLPRKGIYIRQGKKVINR